MVQKNNFIIRWLLFGYHFIIALTILIVGLYKLEESFLISVASSILFVWISYGIWTKNRWVILPTITSILISTIIACSLTMADLIWSEALIIIFISGYLIFSLVEISTVMHASAYFGNLEQKLSEEVK